MSQIVKSTMSLTAGVCPETYYKVQDICKESGTYVSEWLNGLIDNAITEYRFRTFENENNVKNETDTKPKKIEPPATDAQMDFIKKLCQQTGKQMPKKKLSISEANLLIKELIHTRDMKWREYYEGGNEDDN